MKLSTHAAARVGSSWAAICCGLVSGLLAFAAWADDTPANPSAATDNPSSGWGANKAASPEPREPRSPSTQSAQTSSQASSQEAGPTAAQQLLLQAMGLVGVRYKWGGKDPETGLDCSGFVRYVFQNSLNIALPHNALAMSRIGANIDRTELRPGDLVFFNTLGRTFSHVGIYLGDNRFIHSPRAGKSVETSSLGEAYWQKRWNGARRVASESGEGINLAGLLAVAGNPEAVQLNPDEGGKHCKQVVRGKGKHKKTVTVCERTSKSSKSAGKSAKGGKAGKSGGKAAKKSATKKKSRH